MLKYLPLAITLTACNIRALASLQTGDAVYGSQTLAYEQTQPPYNPANDNLMGVTTALPPFTEANPNYPNLTPLIVPFLRKQTTTETIIENGTPSELPKACRTPCP